MRERTVGQVLFQRLKGLRDIGGRQAIALGGTAVPALLYVTRGREAIEVTRGIGLAEAQLRHDLLG